jgi:hypothetical protein
VGTKKNTVREFRTITGDDVRSTQHRTVVTFEKSLLGGHLKTVASELLHNPLGTVFVSLAVHRTGTEVALLLTEGVGTVGTEGRANRVSDGRVGVGGLLAKTAGE